MHELKSLSNKHQAMMKSLVLEGVSQRVAAEMYSLSEQQVSIVVNSPLWKKEAAALRDRYLEQHTSKVMELVPKAVQTYADILDRKSSFEIVDPETGDSKQVHVPNPPASRLKAAEGILNIAGMGKDRDEGKRSIIIQLYKPGWDGEGSGKVIDVEVT